MNLSNNNHSCISPAIEAAHEMDEQLGSLPPKLVYSPPALTYITLTATAAGAGVGVDSGIFS